MGNLEREKWIFRSGWGVELDGKIVMKRVNWGGIIFRGNLKCEFLEFKDNFFLKERGYYYYKGIVVVYEVGDKLVISEIRIGFF